MQTRFKGQTINNQPATDWRAVYRACARHERFIIEVRRYDSAAEISMQQMKYLHAVVIPALAAHIGCSLFMAEQILKKKCGEQWLVKEIDGDLCILSKKTLTVKQTTQWLENCWDWMESIGCPVPPPDPNWRMNKAKERRESVHGRI